MKTIAVDDAMWKKLKQLKDERGVTFEDIIEDALFKAKKIPRSMFGAAKGIKPLTQKERKEMWQDDNRD